jgi:hypothetical protein
MKKYILSILSCTLLILFADAQKKSEPSSKYKFISTVNFGLLEGRADKSFGQIQLVNGVKKNTWLYSIGIGVDYYGAKRSAPLFIDVKKDLKSGKKIPFVYFDGGYNFSWLRDKEKITFGGFGGHNYKQRGGLFYEAGMGYKFVLKSKLALGFSAGYSYKQSKEIYTPFIWIDFPPYPNPNPSAQNSETYDYKFRRISFKLSCWF